MYPKVSIIWLNHNSKKIINIALQFLESIADLSYPSDRYELIVVDNGSTDGSFETIRSFLEKKTGLRKKIIRLDKNLGFTGGNNVGYKARDRESKYVLLLNNDAIIKPDGLEALVEYAERYRYAGALQGVVLRYRSGTVDTAGDFHDELLSVYVLGRGKNYHLKHPIYVTFVDGCCALYRVEAISRCCGDKLFIDEFFGYGDDNVLGLLLWNRGYRCISVDRVVAEHLRSASFGRASQLSTYLNVRTRTALAYITNTRYRNLVLLGAARVSILSLSTAHRRAYVKAFLRSGKRLAQLLKMRGMTIDLYKAPIVRIPLAVALRSLASRRVLNKYFEHWFHENMDKLKVED